MWIAFGAGWGGGRGVDGWDGVGIVVCGMGGVVGVVWVSGIGEWFG